MNKNLTLYTFQPLFVWETLCDLGYYHPFFIDELDPDLKNGAAEWDWSFLSAYTWLKNQMNKRGIVYENNNSHMIWAWHHWASYKKTAPDKRYASVYNYFKTEPYVMMELSIPKERVLLSDYDSWHFVLNYWYFEKRRKSDKFVKEYNYYRIKPKNQEEIHPLMSESWEQIFDMKLAREIIDIPKKAQQIQATFFELFYNDVKKVHFFSDKKCQSVLVI